MSPFDAAPSLLVDVRDVLLTFLYSARDEAEPAAFEAALSLVTQFRGAQASVLDKEKLVVALLDCFETRPTAVNSVSTPRGSQSFRNSFRASQSSLQNAVAMQALHALLRALVSSAAPSGPSAASPRSLTTPEHLPATSHPYPVAAAPSMAAAAALTHQALHRFSIGSEHDVIKPHPLGGRRATLDVIAARRTSALNGNTTLVPLVTQSTPFSSSAASPVVSRSPAALAVTTEDAIYEVNDVDGSTSVNQYTLLNCLGNGTQGEVHLAFDEKVCEFRAVKVMRRPDTKGRFGGTAIGTYSTDVSPRAAGASITKAHAALIAIAQEVRIMKRLRHPNIIKLYEVVDDPKHDEIYLVMQYAQHGSLATISRDGTCSITVEPLRLANLGLQLAEAISYIHDRGVVHRDIKPENIFLGTDDRVFLGDFGSAEILAAPTPTSAATTHRRGFKGTFAFLAPELLSTNSPTPPRESPRTVSPSALSAVGAASSLSGGENGGIDGGLPVTTAVDVWALGVTLYALLFGKLPFALQGPMAASVDAILHAPIPMLPLPSRQASLLKQQSARSQQHQPTATAAATAVVAMGMGVSAADDGSESGESGGAGAPSPMKLRLTDARAFAAISSSIEHVDDTINDNLPPPVIRHPPRRDALDVMSLWKQCIFRMLDRNARTRATARDVVGYLRNLIDVAAPLETEESDVIDPLPMVVNPFVFGGAAARSSS